MDPTELQTVGIPSVQMRYDEAHKGLKDHLYYGSRDKITVVCHKVSGASGICLVQNSPKLVVVTMKSECSAPPTLLMHRLRLSMLGSRSVAAVGSDLESDVITWEWASDQCMIDIYIYIRVTCTYIYMWGHLYIHMYIIM